MVNDEIFLEKYVEASKLIFSSLINDLVAIKDSEFRYLTLTYKMVEFMRQDSADKILGKTASEIDNYLDSERVEKYKRQNLEILRTKTNRAYLEIEPVYDGKAGIYIVHKTPIINPTTNNSVGIRVQITNMYWPNTIKSLFRIHSTKGLLLSSETKGDTWKEYPLNEMQHAVLFLCLNNYSYSQIALLLSSFGHKISNNRVNDYLEQLKLIFHVRNKTHLIEKALGLNFHTYLPTLLFNRLTSIDISSDVASIIFPEN